MKKQALLSLIGAGKTRQAIDELMTLTSIDTDTKRGIILLSNRYKELERNRLHNLTDDSTISIERNRINEALSYIIDELPFESSNLSSVNNPAINNQKTILKIGAIVIAAIAILANITTIAGYFKKPEPTTSSQKIDTPNSNNQQNLEPTTKPNNTNKEQASKKTSVIPAEMQPNIKNNTPITNSNEVANVHTQTVIDKKPKSFELIIITNSDDKVLINGRPANSSSTIKRVEIIEGERYEIIINNCDPFIIPKVSKNETINRCS